MNKNTTTTTTTTTEYLSAFLDDEAGAFEQRRMLDEVQKDNGLQQKVAHFSLIGEAMRNEQSSVTVQANFLMGIHQQLDAEPEYAEVHIAEAANEPSQSTQSKWLSPISGLALAASLAAVTFVAINLKDQSNSSLDVFDGNEIALLATQETENSAQQKITIASNEGADFHTIDLAWRNRLKGYVNSHAKYASTSAIMPSVRAASYASNF